MVGQDEVKACLSKNIEEQMEVFYNQGRCRFKAEGASWKDLLDTISELLAYQLQEASFHRHLLNTVLAMLAY